MALTYKSWASWAIRNDYHNWRTYVVKITSVLLLCRNTHSLCNILKWFAAVCYNTLNIDITVKLASVRMAERSKALRSGRSPVLWAWVRIPLLTIVFVSIA